MDIKESEELTSFEKKILNGFDLSNYSDDEDPEDFYALAKAYLSETDYKIPKKAISINSLKLLKALCETVMNDRAPDGSIPMNIRFTDDHPVDGKLPNVTLTKVSFLFAKFYSDGLELGLGGKPLLDFVNNNVRRIYKTFLEFTKLYETKH